VWGVETRDGSVHWVSLGPFLPAGSFHLCVQAGTTTTAVPPVPPPWSAEEGNIVDRWDRAMVFARPQSGVDLDSGWRPCRHDRRAELFHHRPRQAAASNMG
jgi:hypothetical protein